MNELTTLGKYNGVKIKVRPGDQMINATQMAKACGKLWANYWQLKSTQEFIAELARSIGIPIDRLVRGVTDGPNHLRGTWVHRHVAIDFAQWLSASFKVWCIQRLDELFLTGKTLSHREHTEAMLCKTMQDVGTAIVGIQQTQALLVQDVSHVKEEQRAQGSRLTLMQADVAYVKSKVDGERKPFGGWIHEALAHVVWEHFKGKCPVCEQTQIVEYPWRRLRQWEVHHWRMKGGNRRHIAFPLCKQCHDHFTMDPTMHEQHEALFMLIQKWARPAFESNNPNKQ
jgi:hypothetical protein